MCVFLLQREISLLVFPPFFFGHCVAGSNCSYADRFSAGSSHKDEKLLGKRARFYS